MDRSTGLTVRHFEREHIDLPAEFVVSMAQRGQIQFGPTSTAVDHSTVDGRSIDLSSGGTGVVMREFVPRMTEGSLRLFDPTPVGTRDDGTPILEVTFEHGVIVRRVRMIEHQPLYLIGLSFLDPEPDLEDRIEQLIHRFSMATKEDDHGGP